MAEPATLRPVRGYRTVAAVAVPLAGLLLRDPDARRGHRGRIDAARHFGHWARDHRDPARRLAWFHAASVGESLQAAAVIAAFRAEHPDWQVVASHFSPSAERIADQLDADVAGYSPYDRRADVAATLAALRPDLLVFTKLDVWPELATAAARGGAVVALIAATVDPASSRRHRLARWVGQPGYRALAAVAAITAADGARVVELGGPAAALTVTGDPRVDSVLQRQMSAAPGSPQDPALLVAGSTWRGDEAVLLEAFARVLSRRPEARLWLVPHQPASDVPAAIAAQAASFGLPVPLRDDDTGADAAPLVVVNRIGVLAALYGRASIAYVGGGFGHRGVHSVLEPAAHGVPIMIGPHDRGLRDAALLADAGALIRLPEHDPAGALATQWTTWLADPSDRTRRGSAARTALEPDRGAAGRTAAVLRDVANRQS